MMMDINCGRIGNGPIITILGFKNTFDYFHVGGLDSFYRRIANTCLGNGKDIRFLQYGCHIDEHAKLESGLIINKVRDFSTALDMISDCDGPIIVNAIHRIHRMKFMNFRRLHRDRSFHMVYSVYSDSMLRRELYMLESFLMPFNGKGLALSPRLTTLCNARRNCVALFIPPVDDGYYCAPHDKSKCERIRVTFMGRIDPGKGIDDVIAIFRQLSNTGMFDLRISGYIWPHSFASRRSEEMILSSDGLVYEPIDYSRWSPDIERKAVERLKETDILVLPYKRLCSSVDIPLLLLEGMAASCAVITKPLGDIPKIYGDSPFMIDDPDFIRGAVNVIMNCRERLVEERNRVWNRIKNFDVASSNTFRRLGAIVSLE